METTTGRASRVNETRARETDGVYADGTPRPTGYAMGVQVARRDAAMYGPNNITNWPAPGTDYARGYQDAMADARDAASPAKPKRAGRRAKCAECGIYPADANGGICEGCHAYREHTATA